jgi:hypothetical protein
MNFDNLLMTAVIEQAGLPALSVGFTIGVIILLLAGLFIWYRRHRFFDPDPQVDNDVQVVRHNREQEIIFVSSAVMLVLLFILYQVLNP